MMRMHEVCGTVVRENAFLFLEDRVSRHEIIAIILIVIIVEVQASADVVPMEARRVPVIKNTFIYSEFNQAGVHYLF